MGLLKQLFGEKCSRCGQRYTVGGENICATCQAELKAREEEIRRCPVDGTPMIKQVRLNIVVDECPACSGIWLDGGELDVVQRGIATAAAGEQYALGLLTARSM